MAAIDKTALPLLPLLMRGMAKAGGTPAAAAASAGNIGPLPDNAGLPGNTAVDLARAELLARRIGALALDDQHRRRKAFRLYLDAVLLDAFGDGLAGADDFDQLVEQVVQRMEMSPELGAAIAEAGALLLDRQGKISS
ncbi:MAG: hypothetical protein ACRYGK_11470 [Janthinobacterium lividum]